MLAKYLDILSAAVLPVLLLLLIVAAFSKYRQGSRALAFLGWSGVALFITFVLAHINRWEFLWKSHLAFPSGHMTFFASAATSLVLLNWRWLFFAVPIGVLYAWLVVNLMWHSWFDIAGAVLMAPAITWFGHRISRVR